MMKFDELMARWEWKPIRNCPGRYVLTLSDQFISFERLLGGHYQIHSFACSTAKDTVLVFPLEDGGLISYAREDGSILAHTQYLGRIRSKTCSIRDLARYDSFVLICFRSGGCFFDRRLNVLAITVCGGLQGGEIEQSTVHEVFG